MIAIAVLIYVCVLFWIFSSSSLPDKLGLLTVPTCVLVAALLIAAGTINGLPILTYLGVATIGTPVALVLYVLVAFRFFKFKPWG